MKKFVSVLLIYLILHSCISPSTILNSNNSLKRPPLNLKEPIFTPNKTATPFFNSKNPQTGSIQSLKINTIPRYSDNRGKKKTLSASCDSNVLSNYISTTDKIYKNETDTVELYFDGVYVEYGFEQIGFIEVFGNENSKTEELLQCLKSQAYNHGADAVISVKKETILKDENNRKYSSPSINGVAVKFYTMDDVDEEPIEFIPLSSKYKKVEKEESSLGTYIEVATASIIFAILLFLEVNIELIVDEGIFDF